MAKAGPVKFKSRRGSASKDEARAALKSSGRLTKLSESSIRIWNALEGYQRRAVDLILKKKMVFVLYKQGTGKTWISLSVLAKLAVSSKDAFRAIVVVPLTNRESTWAKLLAKELPELEVTGDFNLWRKSFVPSVLLVHYEALPSIIDRLRKVRFMVNVMIYDESQRLKQRTSKTSKMAKRLASIAEHRVALTGTPIDKDPMEMYAQFRFIKPELLGTWETFKDRWCIPVPKFEFNKKDLLMVRARKWKEHMIKFGKPRFDMTKLDEFLEVLAPWSIIQDDSVLKQPDMREIVSLVDMTPRQAKLYEDMKKNLVVSIARGKTVTAAQRGVALWKLHQIAGGYLIDEDGLVHRISDAKLEETLALIPKSQCVIACKYVHEVEDIAWAVAQRKKRVGVLYGRTKKSLRLEVQNKFQRGELDVVVMQIKTGGVGIDLFAADTILFFSLTHSFIDYDQAKARIRRRGQKRPTRAYLICSARTIDETLVAVLRTKRKVTEKVLVNLVRGS